MSERDRCPTMATHHTNLPTTALTTLTAVVTITTTTMFHMTPMLWLPRLLTISNTHWIREMGQEVLRDVAIRQRMNVMHLARMLAVLASNSMTSPRDKLRQS